MTKVGAYNVNLTTNEQINTFVKVGMRVFIDGRVNPCDGLIGGLKTDWADRLKILRKGGVRIGKNSNIKMTDPILLFS